MTLSAHGPRLVGGLAVVLLVSACGPQSAPAPAPTPTPAHAAAVAAEPVTRGAIQQTLAYSGEIRAKQQVSVLPKSTGRVEHVLVDVGSQVKAGQILVALETDAPRLQLLQARAALAAVQAKLASLQAGPRAEDVSAAEAALSQQQIHLQEMQSGGRTEDVQLAQAALDAQQARLDLLLSGGRAEAIQQAQAGLDAANAKLSAVQKGATDDVRQAAQSNVDAGKAAVASTEAAYAALGTSTAADLRAAQSQVDTLTSQVQAAQAAVRSADAALKNLQGSGPADVQQAQSDYDAAVAQRDAAQATLAENNHPTQAAIAQAEATLADARAQRQQAEASQSILEHHAGGACGDMPGQAHNGTACRDARTAADAAISAGNAVVEAAQGRLDLLTRGGSPSQQAQSRASLDSAEAQVKAAKARLEALESGGIEAQRAQLVAARENASSQLAAAQQSLAVAQARLNAVTSGAQDAQVKSTAAQVIAARGQLKSDQAKLDQVLAGPTDEDLQQAQAAVDQAQQQLMMARRPSTDQDIRAQRAAVQQAELQLRKALAPYTPAELQQQQQAVVAAEAQLHKAQNPYTDQDLQAAQAAVDQAQAQVDQAELGLAEAQITAPVDATVAERLVAPGALVNPQTPLVTLVPPALELVVNVEESQLGQVAEGQAVQLMVPAFPQQTFNGTVRSIAPTLDSKSRTAAVRIEPHDASHRLRAGMFATLSIITAARDDALLVPREGISSSGGADPAVLTIEAGTVHRVPVRLGLQNDRFAEIVGGLSEGQLVATSSLSNLGEGDVVEPQVQTIVALAR